MPLALLGASVSTAHACSIVQSAFQPRQEDFNRPEKGDNWEPIPAPIVEVTRLTRGDFSGTAGDCSDIGWLVLDFSLPSGSGYRIEDFGVYFRVKRGVVPSVDMFRDAPLAGDIENGKLRIALYWEDDDRSEQAPLDLDVETFLVAPDLSIGASTVLTVKEKRDTLQVK
jgi:hypothetical protein